jgi:tripeptide aminopeptidase
VGEEGEGNLRGVRHLFEHELAGKVDYFVTADAPGATIVKDAVGSYRYTVTFRGPGGHSYAAFGTPSPIHALGRAIAKISEFQVPQVPRTTFTVGTINGGTSVNAIAYEASMQVDMRSEDPQALDDLDAQFQAAVQAALEDENGRWSGSVELTVELDRWGTRPAGRQDANDPIVDVASRAAAQVGLTFRLVSQSTDANLPMSMGIPSIAIGWGGSVGGVHALDEWFDTTESHVGTQWVLLTTVALAGVR